ncbi:MAG: hypothetical protein FJY65_00640 [Calditrichaeota bacterium]|nr:hypothetical protein [Calditrichota bacterium]
MRCPSCKGSISTYNFLKEKHCPACGEVLKRAPTREQVREFLIWFAEDKGYIFWAIVFWVVVWIIAFFELIFAEGVVLDYITHYWIRFLFMAAFAGSIIDYVAKANIEVTAVRNKFIFRPPRYLRSFRRWTNVFAILGLGLAGYVYYHWPNYVGVIPIFTFIPSFLICLWWAVMGLILTEDDMNDKRIRYFMEEMRIGRVKYYHRAAAMYVGGFFVGCVVYYNLVQISGLWFYISNSRIVYDISTFLTQYFGWMKHFAR